jgi:metal-dependent amidase/aminoacylase/carboxypeptidase family protein
MKDRGVLMPRSGEEQGYLDNTHEYLLDIDHFIRVLEPSLWPLNSFLHNNPELAFKEHKAHDALTNFMQSQEGWHVTPSAYGMETAWVADYDSGRPGPVVSFNAEMGTVCPAPLKDVNL